MERALELEERALKIGAEICGKLGFPLTPRQHDSRNLSFPTQGKWDLIIIGHALCSQYETKESQSTFITSLLTRLEENGHLLLVESSQSHENQRFLALRDLLVAKGVSIHAPCIWKGECPVLKSGSYCYAQRPFEKPSLIKEIQRAANINLSSLKMSYLIIRAPASSPLSVLDKRYYRVVSPPVETFRGERFFLCGTDGKKTLGSRLKLLAICREETSYLLKIR
jgi:ribosomal protein RSM22 (predicted rRNA methylase)